MNRSGTRVFGVLFAYLVSSIAPNLFTTKASASESNAPQYEAEDAEFAAARRHLANELPAEIEIALAVSAAPPHLRRDADVYLYTRPTGYTLHQRGDNGFTCLVNRDGFLYGSRAFKPTCWDPNGKESYIPLMLAVGRWLSEGVDTPEIRARIESGFEQAEFVAPDKTGGAYMLNGDLELDTRTGRTVRQAYPGHLMIYATTISSADLGVTRRARQVDPALPFVFSKGAGGERLGYIITMVGHVGESTDD